MTKQPKPYESATGPIPLDNFGNDIKPPSDKRDALDDYLDEKHPLKEFVKRGIAAQKAVDKLTAKKPEPK